MVQIEKSKKKSTKVSTKARKRKAPETTVGSSVNLDSITIKKRKVTEKVQKVDRFSYKDNLEKHEYNTMHIQNNMPDDDEF